MILNSKNLKGFQLPCIQKTYGNSGTEEDRVSNPFPQRHSINKKILIRRFLISPFARTRKHRSVRFFLLLRAKSHTAEHARRFSPCCRNCKIICCAPRASVSDFRASRPATSVHFLYSRVSAPPARARLLGASRYAWVCARTRGLIVVQRVAKESISKLRKAVSRVTNAERERARLRNAGSRSPGIGSARQERVAKLRFNRILRPDEFLARARLHHSFVGTSSEFSKSLVAVCSPPPVSKVCLVKIDRFCIRT